MRGQDETVTADSGPLDPIFQYDDIRLVGTNGLPLAIPFDLDSRPAKDTSDFLDPGIGAPNDVVILTDADKAGLGALEYDKVELYPEGGYRNNLYAWDFTIGAGAGAFDTKASRPVISDLIAGFSGTDEKVMTLTLGPDFLNDPTSSVGSYKENTFCEPTSLAPSVIFNPHHYIAHYVKSDDIYKKITAQLVDASGVAVTVDHDGDGGAVTAEVSTWDILVPINEDYYKDSVYGGSSVPDHAVSDYTGAWDSGRFYNVGGAIRPPEDSTHAPRGWYVSNTADSSVVVTNDTNNGDIIAPSGDLSGTGGYVRQDDFYGVNPLLRIDETSENNGVYSLTDSDTFYIVYDTAGTLSVTAQHKRYNTNQEISGWSGTVGAEYRQNPYDASVWTSYRSFPDTSADYVRQSRGNAEYLSGAVVVGVEVYYLDDPSQSDEEDNRIYIPYDIVGYDVVGNGAEEADDTHVTTAGAGTDQDNNNFTKPQFLGEPWESQDKFFGVKIEQSQWASFAGKQIYVDFYYESDTENDGIPVSERVVVQTRWRGFYGDELQVANLQEAVTFHARHGNSTYSVGPVTIYIPNTATSFADLSTTGASGDSNDSLNANGHDWNYSRYSSPAGGAVHDPVIPLELTAGQPAYAIFDYLRDDTGQYITEHYMILNESDTVEGEHDIPSLQSQEFSRPAPLFPDYIYLGYTLDSGIGLTPTTGNFVDALDVPASGVLSGAPHIAAQRTDAIQDVYLVYAPTAQPVDVIWRGEPNAGGGVQEIFKQTLHGYVGQTLSNAIGDESAGVYASYYLNSSMNLYGWELNSSSDESYLGEEFENFIHISGQGPYYFDCVQPSDSVIFDIELADVNWAIANGGAPYPAQRITGKKLTDGTFSWNALKDILAVPGHAIASVQVVNTWDSSVYTNSKYPTVTLDPSEGDQTIIVTYVSAEFLPGANLGDGIVGENHVRYSGKDVLFSASKNYYDSTLYPTAANLDGVSVDGSAAGNFLTVGTQYTVEHGSTEVTLLDDYLDTLALGAHTLTLHYSDGVKITGLFYVLENPPPLYSLTVNAGTGGTITGTPSGSYAANTAISLTAAPNAGYTFTGWTVNGATVDTTANPLAFAMPAGTVTVTANFNADDDSGYTLTVNAGTGGSITGTSSGSYVPGIGITLLATPNAGYTFTGWTISGVAADASANPLSFSMPENNVSVTANFKADGAPKDDGTLPPGTGDNANPPGTGDSANPMLWFTLLFLALAGISLTAVFFQKRKEPSLRT
jgi:uncharacterized repeat protein (TIGR02543 family)